MDEQVQVIVDFPPTEPATPEGPTEICNDNTSDYESEGVEDADSYTWILSPENAGVLTTDDLFATVEWDSEFSGTANLSLYGTNECGNGNPSAQLEILIDAIPQPEIEGEELVCNNHIEEYSVEENDGNTYSWVVSGGEIISGEDSYMITVEWGEPGDGLVSVIEETVNGCISDTTGFEVLVDDCTNIDENAETDFKIFPNPASSSISIQFNENPGDQAEIEILNQLGQVLIKEKLSVDTDKNIYQLNISYLNTGIYFVKVVGSEGHTKTKQLVVK